MTLSQLDVAPETSLADSVSNESSMNYVETIETVISSLETDQSAMVSHTDTGHTWKFKYGTVEVYVQLTGTTESDTLTVWSPVLKLPARDEPKLMRHLLEMNCGETFEACFGILGDDVVVLSSRTLADIDASEISRVMTIVATIADNNDEQLRSDHGNP